MTSTTDMAQHPDVSEISDLAEGLLPPSRAADIRDHLDGCALCADVHDSLEEIRGLLGTLPGPPRMPTDVAERIDAALAAEALLNATAPDETAHVSRETSRPSEAPAESDAPSVSAESSAPDVSSVDASSAEAVRAGRPAGRPRAATGPGRTAQSRRRRRTAVLGAVFGTAAVGVSVLLLQSLNSSTADIDAQTGSALSSTKSDGEEFTEDRLQSSVDALLASGSAADPEAMEPGTEQVPPRERSGSSSNAPLLRPTLEVPPCIEQGIGRTEPVLAAQQGMYQGSRAYLVVLSHSTDSSQIQAYVVDATCVDNRSSAKGKVLLTHAYPRR
ncbi:anti-sigma factor family protein [Streptomyces sp. NPDC059568]|uniref:anti-sigma factor family protein n=1 Tax=Streptomyces sp. NPDC059568 TaxID=3346868 RepID=UPI0036881B3D